MVRNEADIVESFVRYHGPLFAQMIILDNGSTDGTSEILVKLAAEGLEMTLLHDDRPSFDQASIITNLARLAMQRFSADVVFPIDSDEFLVKRDGSALSSDWITLLASDAITLLPWKTYIPKSGLQSEGNPVISITQRHATEPTHDYNLILPVKLVAGREFRIGQGSHRIEVTGEPEIVYQMSATLALAHLPVRSLQQAQKKYLIGWLANLCRGELAVFDWISYYNRLKTCDDSMDIAHDLAARYNVTNKNLEITCLEEPINISHTSSLQIRYPVPSKDILATVLDYSESLALALAKARPESKREQTRTHYDHFDEQCIRNQIGRFEELPGWLSSREAVGLFKSALEIEASVPSIVELGTWRGRSSYVLAKAILERGAGRLHCVDPFDGSGDYVSEAIYKQVAHAGPEETMATIRSSLEMLGVGQVIEFHISTSLSAAMSWQGTVDMLFVDANHEFEHICADFDAWLPHLSADAILAVHDVGSGIHSGPRRFVEETVLHNDFWQVILQADELFVSRRIRGRDS
jgi:predicted O-methyltransferase YrrM/glycosyltransferase involved in cell wall biosynthesis